MQKQTLKLMIFLVTIAFLFGSAGLAIAENESANEHPGHSAQEGQFKKNRKAGGPRGQKMRKKMGMLKGRAQFLKFSKEYYESVRDPHSAIGFAVLGILQKHRRSKTPQKAIAELEKILASTKDQGARNIILFSIRQVYERTKDAENFSKTNDQILSENLKAVEK